MMIVAVALFAMASAAQAVQTQAYSATQFVGNQSFGGSLGLDFEVNSPIVISDLGVFDHNQDGISTNGSLIAELWSRNENGTPGAFGDDTGIAVLATLSFDNASPGTLTNGFRLKPLGAPLLISPGSYTMVAYGFDSPDDLYNSNGGANTPTTNDGGGLITFEGVSRFNLTAGLFPTTPDGGPAARYHAGTFVFAAPAVPEPVTVGLFVMSGLALLARRRRVAA